MSDNDMADFQQPKPKRRKLMAPPAKRWFVKPTSPLKIKSICQDVIPENTRKQPIELVACLRNGEKTGANL